MPEAAESPAIGVRPRLTSVVSRLAGANLALVVVTIVTAPLQARALGPEGRGELAAILVPLSLAPIVLTLGLNLYTLRAAASGRRAGTLLGTIGTLFLALGLVGAALGPLVAALIGGDNHVVRTWIIIAFALLPVGFVNMVVTDIAAGQERWGPVLAYRITPAAMLLVGVVGLYVGGHLTVSSAALVSVVSGTLPVVFLALGARRLAPLHFDWLMVREAVPFGLKAWAAALGQLINVRVDQLLMTRLVHASELGLYAVAVSASGTLVNALALALAQGTMPRFTTGSPELVERTLRSTLLVVLAIGAAVAMAAPLMVPLVFGSAFDRAVPMIWILLVASVPMAGGAVLSSALTSSGRPIYAAVAEIVALGVTIPGLFVLLPAMGGIGAAVVSVLAYSTSFFVLVLMVRRQLGAHLTSLLIPRPSDGAAIATAIRSHVPERALLKFEELR